MGALVIVRLPWKRGSVAGTAGPVVVSATKFTYKRGRDLAGVTLAGLRLRRGWPTRRGAIALIVASDARRRTTYSLSVWRSEEDLREFLRAPDHVPLIRRYRPRLEASTAELWRADTFVPGETWREAARRWAGA
jgi:hypothetical protein